MHFPHVRIAGGAVTVYEAQGNNPMDLFERLRREDGWHHSIWNGIALAQSSPTKAHYTVRTHGTERMVRSIGVYDSLYVLSFLSGHWKIQCRSSFGP
jgi:hypothetical protein